MAETSKLLTDSFSFLYGGMDETKNPTALDAEFFSRGINIQVRGGSPQTRPALRKLMNSPAPGIVFKGAGRWSLESGDRLVFVVGLTLYSLKLNTMTLTVLGNFFTGTQCTFCQMDKYMVVQDAVNQAVILYEDAGVDKRYTGDMSIPTGGVMQYVYGRLQVVANDPGWAYFKSGDICLPSNPASGLLFTETDYWSGGGAHGLPAEMGYIYGMGTIRNAHTGTGVGGLIVLARNGLVAFDMSTTRTEWFTTQIAQVLFFGSGTRSPWSVIPVNADLVYRGLDGLRVLRYTQAWVSDTTGVLSNMPQSGEVPSLFPAADGPYLPYVSCSYNDNYILTTVKGVNSRFFRGLAVLDTLPLYNLREQASPAYCGLWTGLQWGQAISAEVEARGYQFFFTNDGALWWLTADYTTDAEGQRIESRLITKAFNFEDSLNAKQLRYVELWLSNILEDTDVKVYFRPTGYAKWTQAGQERTILVPADGTPGYKRRIRFPVDLKVDTCNPTTGEPLYLGTEFQIAIEWTGFARIERGFLVAERMNEAPPDMCDGDEPVLLPTVTGGVELDDFSYVIGG